VHWYLLTGEVDAMEAAVDRLEQDHDTQRRAFFYNREPGKPIDFNRCFTRASYNAHVMRWLRPEDPYFKEVSDYLAGMYLKRIQKEPRGLVNGPRPASEKTFERGIEHFVGRQGADALKASGRKFDPKTGQITDPAGGRSWYPIIAPHTWQYPPLSRAMELYYRQTGDEDAHDWIIAYGQAAARVLHQPHGLLTYGRMLVDFPERGVAKDWASWVTDPKTNPHAEGIEMSGFLARFHPDVCARAYQLCGESLLRERALSFFRAGTHRMFNKKENLPLDQVGLFINYRSDHDGQLDFMLRTLFVHAHPRRDTQPPAPVNDLKVTLSGNAATVTFTAPADAGGGKVARYQLKCSDKPIVDYVTFLDHYRNWNDDKVTNWWMANNLAGEPSPKSAGIQESIVVEGIPKGAALFAVRSFDDSNNRSAISNVIEAK
jgi:hypothetical protein